MRNDFREYFRQKLGSLRGALRRLSRDHSGTYAVTFGIISVPVLLAIGVSIDYVRAYNVYVKMQSDLDAALIAAVKDIDKLSDAEIRKKIVRWFSAQADAGQASYVLAPEKMQIHRSDYAIQAVAAGTVPTTFLGIANINEIDVSVVSSVAGPAISHLNVYIVLDKSASMMLAATTKGQNDMRSVTGNCVFGCHVPEGGPYSYGGYQYQTNYDLAKAMGVELRADVSVKAAKKVLSMIDSTDPAHSRIKVGLYSIGDGVKQVLAPTYSTNAARTALSNDAYGLTSATSEDVSHFNVSLPALASVVGNAGDGSSASKPLKLVLVLTDGVQSERPWVMSSNNGKVTPLNPAWCGALKGNNATVGILYTEYLPMTWDEGYSRTLDLSMKSSEFTSTWGGTIRDGVDPTIKRLNYLSHALNDCASSPDLFLSAGLASEIESGLASLFETYLSSVRLTQ